MKEPRQNSKQKIRMRVNLRAIEADGAGRIALGLTRVGC